MIIWFDCFLRSLAGLLHVLHFWSGSCIMVISKSIMIMIKMDLFFMWTLEYFVQFLTWKFHLGRMKSCCLLVRLVAFISLVAIHLRMFCECVFSGQVSEWVSEWSRIEEKIMTIIYSLWVLVSSMCLSLCVIRFRIIMYNMYNTDAKHIEFSWAGDWETRMR